MGRPSRRFLDFAFLFRASLRSAEASILFENRSTPWPKRKTKLQGCPRGQLRFLIVARNPLCNEELQLKVRKLCVADENLGGVTVEIFVTDGFEQVELTEPKKAFDEAGAETQVVSPKGDQFRE